jgi:L-ascorbate metabolism protein UlaG (beta-lactamase superfamily)
MKIKKIGHCCLLIQLDKLTILTDPGSYSTGQNQIKDIDIVLITHEHADHFHADSVKEILANNPKAKVITNSAVGAKLSELGITHDILEGRAMKNINGVNIEAFDAKHEEIFKEFGQVQNTGYFIDEKLFYPGDSYHNPQKPVDILALPVSGPWCKIGDAVRYALEVKPKQAFPVHDATLQKERIGGSHRIPEKFLTEAGIKFVAIVEGDEKEF